MVLIMLLTVLASVVIVNFVKSFVVGSAVLQRVQFSVLFFGSFKGAMAAEADTSGLISELTR